VDGWNAVRSGGYDLVISDVDMPRMDGIGLVRSIKGDPGLRSTPVVIVSYKDREEDRMRGLDAGADGYLTKGSFHDRTFLDAVAASVSGHLGRVYEAMGLGALDAVDTPEMGPSGAMDGASTLLAKIATIAKLVGRPPRPGHDPPPRPSTPSGQHTPAWPLVAI